MKLKTVCMSLTLAASLIAGLPHCMAAEDGDKAKTSVKSAEESEYERNMAVAQAASKDQAKLAEEAKKASDKQRSEEALEQKRKDDLASIEKIKRDAEDTLHRQEATRLAKIEQQKQIKADRERSCEIKPVMTDKEIINCKKVWR